MKCSVIEECTGGLSNASSIVADTGMKLATIETAYQIINNNRNASK